VTLKEKDDFESVLRTPEGARFIAWLLIFCGVYTNSHEQNKNSPLDTAFREGRRDVGLFLLKCAKEAEGGDRALMTAEAELIKNYREAFRT
jgi:hypothetical protein